MGTESVMKEVNLYGVPFRTWVLMRNSSKMDMESPILSQMEQLRTNQFSSQERNQDSLNKILHEVHDDFYTYFVLIVTVLCGIISAIVFLMMVATLLRFCCSWRGSGSDKTGDWPGQCHCPKHSADPQLV